MEKHLITNRRGEVEREIDRLKDRLEALSDELRELDIAERVFNRLSGAKRTVAAGQADHSASTKSSDKDNLTVRQMIKAALMDARENGLPGLTPKQIRDFIKSAYGRDVKQQANTTASRMWRDLKEIHKDMESGLFSLPSNEKPADDETVEGTSTGLFSQSAQGREAGPGGAQ